MTTGEFKKNIPHILASVDQYSAGVKEHFGNMPKDHMVVLLTDLMIRSMSPEQDVGMIARLALMQVLQMLTSFEDE